MRLLPAVALAVLLVTRVTAAQPDAPVEASAEEREEARELARRGYLQFQQEHHEAAIDLFERAQGLVSAPTHLIFIARSQAAIGRLVAARGTYEEIVGMALKADDPEAFRKAVEDADAELAALRPRIPSVVVKLSGEDLDGVVVAIDGQVVEPGRLGGPIDLDPGEHQIRATRPGGASETVAATLAEAEAAEIPLFLPAVDRTEAEQEHAYLIPAAVTLGLGGALLIAGAATGGVSLAQVGDIKTRCIDNRCPPEDEADADAARTLGHASTALLVVGGLAAAAGTTLLVLGWPAATEEAATSLVVTPGGLRLEGCF